MKFYQIEVDKDLVESVSWDIEDVKGSYPVIPFCCSIDMDDESSFTLVIIAEHHSYTGCPPTIQYIKFPNVFGLYARAVIEIQMIVKPQK